MHKGHTFLRFAVYLTSLQLTEQTTMVKTTNYKRNR